MTLWDLMEVKYTITYEDNTLHYISDDMSHEGMMTLTENDVETLKYNAGQLFLARVHDECKHESDGKVHAIADPVDDERHGLITMKCIKCGELYT